MRYQLRYRDHAGRSHAETYRRLVEADRRKAEIEVELSNGTWIDPRRGEVRLAEWVETRHDLRVTTWDGCERLWPARSCLGSGQLR